MEDKNLFFVNCSTSFNRESEALIAEDKYFTYKLCHDVIHMPKTYAYIDPFVPEQYKTYVTHPTYDAIASVISKQSTFPIVIKRNRGSRGDNVFLCHTSQDIVKALKSIFNQKAKNYDYVALAETYIPIVREFRVVTYEQKVVLLYEKDTTQATYTGNLSPLHWSDAKAVYIEDEAFCMKIASFLQPFFTKLPLSYVGFDVALVADQSLCLIEANTRPGFEYFIRDNGPKRIVELYKTLLEN